MSRRLVAMLAACLATASGCAHAQASTNPVSARVENDTSSMLSDARIAELAGPARDAWKRYVATSRRIKAAEQDSMRREVVAAGHDKATRAPFARAAFEAAPAMAGDWFRTDSARRMLESVLSFQTPSGGWSKHVDFTAGPRALGQSYFSETEAWQYIATIDNNSTTEELRFVAAASRALGEERLRASFLRGLDYLFTAQFPNGCWPQVFPLQGGYHDAATYNDDAIVNVLELLGDVARGDSTGFAWVPAATRTRANDALRRGVSCIVASQYVQDGKRTVWGQQHDALTLLPVKARSYELVGLAGKESAAITRFLMALPEPSDSVVTAVHAAVEWFRAHAITGYDYGFDTGLVAKADAAPIWARLTDLETDKPIFSNRDGVKVFDWNQLTDRRQGYAWFGREPAWILSHYDRWASKHPRTAR